MRIALALTALLLLTIPALADDILLADGRVLSGVTAAPEGDTYVVTLPDEPTDHRIRLAKAAVYRVVGEEDEKGRELVAFAKKKEPSDFAGKRVVVRGRLARHVGERARDDLDRFAATVIAKWVGGEEGIEPVRVEVTREDHRRSLFRARVLVALRLLEQEVPQLSGEPFPLPALARHLAADGGLHGSLFALSASSDPETRALARVFEKKTPPWVGWSLVRHLSRDPDLFAAFCGRVKAGDEDALRSWLANLPGLEEGWRNPKKGEEITRPEQYVDAAYTVLDAKRLRVAARLLDRAIELGSNERGAFEGLAEIYVLTGRETDALRVWQAALAADPLNVRARRSIGLELSKRRSARVGKLFLAVADRIEEALSE
jgi:hypothetical protein